MIYKNSAALKQEAKERLTNQWTPAVLITLISFSISTLLNWIPILGFIVLMLIQGPLLLGMAEFFLNIARKKPAHIEQLFDGFNNYSNAIVLHILILFTCFLWSLLLIIPGIIAAMNYSLSFMILSDNPDMKPLDVMDLSKKMMYGHKMRLFELFFSFIGWFFLSILSFGIGFLWLVPYFRTAFAEFYIEIKEKYEPSHDSEGWLGI